MKGDAAALYFVHSNRVVKNCGKTATLAATNFSSWGSWK
jgi:hypothetical protein